MPNDTITLNVASLNEISLDNFKDSYTGKLKNGSIRLNNCTYSVSFENNKLSVSRNFRILNFFRKNNEGRIFEKLNTSFSEAHISKEQKKDIPNDTVPPLNIQKDSQNNNTHSIGAQEAIDIVTSSTDAKEVALYGLAPTRQIALNSVKQYNKSLSSQGKFTINTITIDEYNFQSNLITFSPEKFPALINKIADDKLTYEHDEAGKYSMFPYFKQRIPDDKLKQWHLFLKDNVDRLNIYGKINKMIELDQKISNEKKENIAPKKTTGWEAEIRQFGLLKAVEHFIDKNLTPEARRSLQDHNKNVTDKKITMLALLLIKISLLSKHPSDDLETKIQNEFKKAEQSTGFSYKNAFLQVIWTAFFRQTSKLGLEFFIQQKTPIIFQWTNINNKSLLGDKGDKDIHNKWWSKDERDFTNYGSITYSEMRHVQRLENKRKLQPSAIIKITEK